MSIIDLTLGTFFGMLMRLCYVITGDFGWTIVVFTFITKIILFPVSLVSQKNSIIMVKIKPLLDDMQKRYDGEQELLIMEQKALYKREKYSSIKALLPLFVQILLVIGVISVINNPVRHLGNDMSAAYFGMDLLAVPNNMLIPLLAVSTTVLLCLVQNKFNVISREQGFWGKWGVMAFLTVLTGWLVFSCPAGIGLYWAYSNLFSIVTLAVCNLIYNPKDYIDYENRSIKLKQKLSKPEKTAKRELKRHEKALEKENMARFFATKKEVVFYSASSGFFKYFQHYIDYILEHSDITVHYLTSDINDQVFEIKRPRFESYFCTSHGLITTFMKMDSDIMVMTMPDLEVYHYKRSLVRKDIEYIYTDHGIGSFHMMLRKGALDHFDTIFCYSKNHNEEVRTIERIYELREKKLVNVGFGLLDMLIETYNSAEHPINDKPQILIAPSWQKDNILEYCLAPLLEGLFAINARIIIRPHPEFVKRFPGKMQAITEKYKEMIGPDFEMQTDFSSNSTVYNSDLVITDWSSIAQEFSFTTKKPSLFINTPMKVMNPEWRKIGIQPMDIWVRDKIGVSLETEKLDSIQDTQETVMELLDKSNNYRDEIETLLMEYMYNMGHTGKAGGEYIIEQIMERRYNNLENPK